jgi:3-oxoacyl-(acyl-carrier-protein) synthase
MIVIERETARARGATIYASIAGTLNLHASCPRIRWRHAQEEIVRAMSLALGRSGHHDEIGYVSLSAPRP